MLLYLADLSTRTSRVAMTYIVALDASPMKMWAHDNQLLYKFL
jgi:hypothetical protein